MVGACETMGSEDEPTPFGAADPFRRNCNRHPIPSFSSACAARSSARSAAAVFATAISSGTRRQRRQEQKPERTIRHIEGPAFLYLAKLPDRGECRPDPSANHRAKMQGR